MVNAEAKIIRRSKLRNNRVKERIKLRWHIYQVDGIEEFLRRAERARGIL